MSFLDNTRRAFGSKKYNNDYEDQYEANEDEQYEEEPPKRKRFSLPFGKKHDDYDDNEYEEDVADERSYRSREQRNSVSSGRTYSGNTSSRQYIQYPQPSSTEVLYMTPKTLENAALVVDYLKENKIVVFDPSHCDNPAECGRIVDYLAGAAKGMDCHFSEFSNVTFCMSPKSIDIRKKK